VACLLRETTSLFVCQSSLDEREILLRFDARGLRRFLLSLRLEAL